MYTRTEYKWIFCSPHLFESRQLSSEIHFYNRGAVSPVYCSCSKNQQNAGNGAWSFFLSHPSTWLTAPLLWRTPWPTPACFPRNVANRASAISDLSERTQWLYMNRWHDIYYTANRVVSRPLTQIYLHFNLLLVNHYDRKPSVQPRVCYLISSCLQWRPFMEIVDNCSHKLKCQSCFL